MCDRVCVVESDCVFMWWDWSLNMMTGGDDGEVS